MVVTCYHVGTMSTKIPSPQQLRQSQEAANAPLIESAVGAIVAGMNRSTNGRIIVDVSVPSHIRPLVTARFNAEGWLVKYHDDQRDGSSVEVTPK